MILLIDIGNSRVKFATLQGDELITGAAYEYSGASSMTKLFDSIVDRPQEIYLLSAGQSVITKRLIDACYQRWDVMPVTLKSTKQCAGVTNAYVDPVSLGSDRWAAIIGGYDLIKDGVLVIDCGTACTADLVDASGRHLGGAIIPGMQMMRQGLQLGTANIGVGDSIACTSAWGMTTAECIEFGVSATLVAFIEKMVEKAVAVLGSEMTVILTGGEASEVIQSLGCAVRYEKELVFLGMAGMVAQYGK